MSKLETLQSRTVEEDRRKDFYRIMLEDSDRLLATIEQILRTGRIGSSSRKPNLSRIDNQLQRLNQISNVALRALIGKRPPATVHPV